MKAIKILIKSMILKVFGLGQLNNKLSELNDQLLELEWANIFRDSIRGRACLENLALHPGRWAGNYSFFYLLFRALTDYKPKKILEFGLGESTKFVSTLIREEIPDAVHYIVESNYEWGEEFNSRFKLSNQSKICYYELEQKQVNNHIVNSYANIEKINNLFDLYLIDGPLGSDRFSRYDICLLAKKIPKNSEFIMIIDDFQRVGEQDTVTELLNIFNENSIPVFTAHYKGVKAQFVISTPKYKFFASI